MTAREMFEKLEYTYKDDELYIEYELNEEFYVRFSKNLKIVSIGNYHITLDELKAINKQCEELGWLE